MDRPGSAEDGQPSMAQRIEQRRAALEARLAAQNAGNGESMLGIGQTADKEPKLGKGELQVRASHAELNRLRVQAQQRVTRYRVECEKLENERRVTAELSAKRRQEKKDEDTKSSRERNGEVEMKWQDLYFKKIPQELQKELNMQKEACSKIMLAKDRLIDDFRQQLKDADDEYVLALQRQASNIDGLISTMHHETDTMIAAYERELDQIEDAYTQERRQLLDTNQDEIQQLMQQRENKEKENSRKRDQKVTQDQQELDHLHEANAEEYAAKKVTLQKDIHTLAQQLEAMRAMYLLNQEKLLYNLRVLGQRTEENKRAIRAHREKMQRLQDNLSGLLMRYSEADKKYRQQNRELTVSYQRITEQYKDLQLKYQHFEKADFDNYNKVWKMNEEECMKYVQKCLQADMIVFQELLSVPWQSPKLDFWDVQESGANTSAAGNTTGNNDGDGHSDLDEDEEEETELSDIAKSMLQMLVTQVPFLNPSEERVRATIDSLEGEDPMAPKKMDAILRSLGCESQQERNHMLTHFVVEKDGGAVLIDPQDAVRALQRYLEDRHRRQNQTTVKSQVTLSKEKVKAQRRKAERQFWERITNVVPLKHERVWKSIEGALEKHLKNLQQRTVLIDETDKLRQQNDELRALLNQYLGTRINQELFAPPQLKVMGGTD
eukprot:PhM_4_TR7813/c0_g1_i1/m.14773/K19754/DRC1; dynein regulatry complex protein 1